MWASIRQMPSGKTQIYGGQWFHLLHVWELCSNMCKREGGEGRGGEETDREKEKEREMDTKADTANFLLSLLLFGPRPHSLLPYNNIAHVYGSSSLLSSTSLEMPSCVWLEVSARWAQMQVSWQVNSATFRVRLNHANRATPVAYNHLSN